MRPRRSASGANIRYTEPELSDDDGGSDAEAPQARQGGSNATKRVSKTSAKESRQGTRDDSDDDDDFAMSGSAESAAAVSTDEDISISEEDDEDDDGASAAGSAAGSALNSADEEIEDVVRFDEVRLCPAHLPSQLLTMLARTRRRKPRSLARAARQPAGRVSARTQPSRI